MACFILIHGAWHGAWTWKRLTPLLRSAGHDVHTPTLTGLGHRKHLLNSQISLSTHVVDVVSFLEAEELENVILVGHSYAGLVAGVVAATTPQSVAGVVYMDSFVGGDGQSLFDLLDAGERDHLRAVASRQPTPWLLPPFPPAGYGVTDAADAKWLSGKLSDMPIACFEERVRYDSSKLSSLRRAYIYATRPDSDRFNRFATPFREDPSCGYYEVPSGHDMMLTHAHETAAILEIEAGR